MVAASPRVLGGQPWRDAGLVKAAKFVTFDLLILELMFLFFKNTVKKAKIQVYILPIL